MKKFLIPVLAVTISVFSAFVSRPTTNVFAFTSGNSADSDDRVNPNNYTLTQPQGCSVTENLLCSIEAVKDGANKPIITTSSALYTALQHGGDPMPNFEFPGIQGKP